MPGRKLDSMLIPLIPEKAEFFEAGSVSFGIETRDLNDNIIDEAYVDDPKGQAVVEQIRATEGSHPDVKGFVSVHVLGADGLEYLRFDYVEGNPHYHYITPQERYNVYFQFDPVTGGDYIDWVFDRLRTKLLAMLKAANAPDGVTAEFDPSLVKVARSKAESAARAGAVRSDVGGDDRAVDS